MVLRHTRFVLGASTLGLLGSIATASSAAPPTLRHQADQQGDVVVFGNTLAVDCSADVPAPPSSTTTTCSTQANVADTAPDLFWRDNDANATITADKARSSATLVMPSGAKVTYARLYWGALKVGNTADTSVILDWLGGPQTTVTADDSWVIDYGFSSHPDWYYYQSTGDVTNYVAQWGAGDFRISDVDALALPGMDVDRAFSAWTLVVFYEKPGDELRNLALFDGFTSVDPGFPGQEKAEVTLSGFLVPNGFTAKMTAFTYEGDKVYTGDFFTFNGQKLSDAENPQDNFFNSSRSYLGSAVSGSADVPKLSGKAGTMAGYDLDTANVSQLVTAGDTSAKVGAESSLDIFLLGGFVTSITNKSPDFPDFEKTAKDLNGGALVVGDEIEYTLTAKNTGNDVAIQTVLTDVVDPGLEFVPGSIEITAGGATGVKTDAKDSDEADYDATSKTITVHLGTGATGSAGGKVTIGTTVTVKFHAKVKALTGSIPNQGEIKASGEAGGGQKSWLSDGDPVTPGSQPTIVTIQECNTDADCPAEKPHCDATTKTCQPCASDADCTDPNFPACQPDGHCGECSETNKTKCSAEKPACNTYTGTCNLCTPEDPSKCANDPNGPVCRTAQDNSNFCGCEKDSDCGNQTSGKVCDLNGTQTCTDGCRGVDGNGCPDGLECTSKDSSIGQCVPVGSGTGGQGGQGGLPGTGGVKNGAQDSGDDGGCGCRVPSGAGGRSAGAFGLLLGLGLLVLRRRRTGAEGPSSL
ncbi:MAG: isopeptide-forming domain-containing fimbrial protein [Myxococcales bacterium]|nr:isopeptide-forming domain-containing fimbrial protein [Myxococcales bacterium]MCB9577907.1 isopeptide-forming domain-containing fimbrial protein [Polyangiaceae bacterium]